MSEPFIPAHRLHFAGGAVQIAFRCPWCRSVHTHGVGDGSLVQGRGNDHCDMAPLGYRLLIVGEVRSRRQLPRISTEDINALSRLLQQTL